MSSAKRIKMGRANYGHTDIARLMASATGRSQTECQGMLGAAFQAIQDALEKGNVINIHGFGKFAIVERKSTMARHWGTNEELRVPPRRVVKFKASTTTRHTIDAKAESASLPITD
ncbi:HU family DNA-binding protein [Comamonas sp. HJ-2]